MFSVESTIAINNVIRLTLAQTDHIKRLPLYIIGCRVKRNVQNVIVALVVLSVFLCVCKIVNAQDKNSPFHLQIFDPLFLSE
jgi:hypothetical protein